MTAPPRRPRARGMTLVELLITLAVMAVLSVVVLQVMSQFQQMNTAAMWREETSGSARAGLAFLERHLRLAGYGIEPAMAFDFNVYRGITSTGRTFCAPVGGDAATTTCAAQRDSTTGADELVFYARNPEYFPNPDDPLNPEGRAWRVVTGTTPAALKLRVRVPASGVGPFFPEGQILQIVCPFAAATTYVEVGASTSVTASGDVSVPLAAAVAGNPFRQNGQLAGTVACLTGGGARAYLVDRYRYFVQTVTLKDGSQTPYLMLDQGIDRNNRDGITVEDLVPVAEGIEDLQVAFLRPTDATTTAEVGKTAALTLCAMSSVTTGGCTGGLRVPDFATLGADKYSAWTFLQFPGSSAMRNEPDSANVLGVHVSLVARAMSEQSTLAPEVLPALFDRAAGTTPSRRVRSVLQSVVFTRNLRARGLSYL